MTQPRRKPNRLEHFNYNTCSAYFLTLCVKGHKCILGKVSECKFPDTPQVKLSVIGQVVEKYIISTNNIENVSVNKYVIMPNHIHIILFVNGGGGELKETTPANQLIPQVVSTLKRLVNKELGKNIFQRSYYDHIIRNQQDYIKHWKYIDTNPSHWKDDKLNFIFLEE